MAKRVQVKVGDRVEILQTEAARKALSAVCINTEYHKELVGRTGVVKRILPAASRINPWLAYRLRTANLSGVYWDIPVIALRVISKKKK